MSYYDGKCMHCTWPHHPDDGPDCRNCGGVWHLPPSIGAGEATADDDLCEPMSYEQSVKLGRAMENIAQHLADTERLDWLEKEAAARCVGATSEMVRQDGNLLAADGWRYRWHPYAQGLPVNMTYTRTLREAIDAIRSATRSGLDAKDSQKASEK